MEKIDSCLFGKFGHVLSFVDVTLLLVFDLKVCFFGKGPNVPGEGEHKIMDFIRKQKKRKDYNPNTRHCLFGQDGDLIMLGLATHEPHFALLREEVVFDQARKKHNQMVAEANLKRFKDQTESFEGEVDDVAGNNLSASIDSYIHNKNFDILHMSILRDYLAYEFETRDVLQDSPFDLEKTIDDFVFMTFIVGNDFLVSSFRIILSTCSDEPTNPVCFQTNFICNSNSLICQQLISLMRPLT